MLVNLFRELDRCNIRRRILFVASFLMFTSIYFIFIPAAEASTTVSGTITQDKVWDINGSPYVLNGEVTIATGVKLTIDPNVVVKGRSEYSALRIEGRLEADGAIFTSYKHDLNGVDSNNDGDLTSPAKGDWSGLDFRSSGNGYLSGCEVLWAGYSPFLSAAVNISGTTSSIAIAGTTISHSSRYGLSVSTGSISPAVTDSLFNDNYSGGLYSAVPLDTLNSNLFTDNTNGPAVKIPATIGPYVFNNSYAGNKVNGMLMNSSSVDHNTEWPATNSPYVINTLAINTDNTLSINSGAVVKFNASVGADGSHSGTGNKLDVKGVLVADGVVFTSYFDDIHGGDTNNDDGFYAPLPGDWYHISFSPGSGSLTNCMILYGGSKPSGRAWGSVYIASSSPTIAGSTIGNSGNNGVYVYSGDPAITGNTIMANNGDGVLTDGAALTNLAGNNFTDNTGYPVRLPATIGSGVHDNQYSNNKVDGMYFTTGTIDRNTVWPASNSPYVTGSLTINTGMQLSVGDTSVIKFLATVNPDGTHASTSNKIDVRGSLVASGTVFTSFFDDAHGGDTNNDGGDTSPLPGDWYHISFSPGGGSLTNNCKVLYGGSKPSGRDWGAVFVAGSSPSIAGSTIGNSANNGIYIDSGAPSITGNTIDGNDGLGLDSGVVLAAFNGNNLTGNTGIAARIPASTGSTVFSNNYSGNGHDALYLTGDVAFDSTWPGNSGPYVLEGVDGAAGNLGTGIYSGVTLTVGDGSVVKYRTAKTLRVDGAIKATGAVFTSYEDDSAGGDTNGDGVNSVPDRGNWSNISFNAGSSGFLRGCAVRYGGGELSTAAVMISGSSPEISNSTISFSAAQGINISSGSPSITGNQINDNAADGLEADSQLAAFNNNAFTGNSGKAAIIPATTRTSVYSNTFSGNGHDALYLMGDVIFDSTWPASSKPYVLEGVTGVLGNLGTTVSSGVTLTVDSGSVVKFGISRELAVEGTLIATGAVFTSYQDDTVAGDTNGDGSLTSPSKGDWAKISMSGGTLNACQIRYGGGGIYGSAGQVLFTGSAAKNISGSYISDSQVAGLNVASGPASISSNYFMNNTDQGLVSAVPLVLSGNYFIANQQEAAKIPAATGASVANNYFAGNRYDAVFLTGPVFIDSTWQASSSPYVLEGENGTMGNLGTEVSQGAVLIIDSGAVVKFRNSKNLDIHGTLNAAGTVFTSWADDSASGDTNGDADTTTPQPGDWESFSFSGGGGHIDGSTIAYGGGDLRHYMVRISDSSPWITNSAILNSSGHGVYIYSGDPLVTGTMIAGNDAPGLESEAQLSNLANNHFANNGGEAANIPATMGAGVQGNTYSGNRNDAMFLTGDVSVDTKWKASNSPYVLVAKQGYLGLLDNEVSTNITLTVEDESVVKFNSLFNESTGDQGGNNGLDVFGTLNASGAVFTSFFDMGSGGDTDGIETAVFARPGDWGDIQFYSGSTGSLFDSVIQYGGHDEGYTRGQIDIASSDVTIRRSAINYSQTWGIIVYSGMPHIHFNDIYANSIDHLGLKNYGSSDLDVAQNWWGAKDGEDGSGDKVENADHEPVLDTPLTIYGKEAQAMGIDTQCGAFGEPVNTSTGAFVYDHTDISIPAKGLPLEFSRTYNSNDIAGGPLGYGWSFNWQMSANPQDNGDIVILNGDGRMDRYFKNPDGSFTAPLGRHGTLSQNAEGFYRLTTDEQQTYNFDVRNNLASVITDIGQTTTINRDAAGRIETIAEPAGRTLSFTYTLESRIDEITDPMGNTVSFGYSQEGNLAQVTDQNGSVTRFTYDANHRVTSIIDANNHNFVNNVYDDQGRVTEQTDAEGNLLLFAYDETNRITTMTRRMDPADLSLDQVTTHHFDDELRLVTETDPYGMVTSYSYDAWGNQESITDRRGMTTRLIHDASGNPVEIFEAYGLPEQKHTRLTYNQKNNPTSVTDPGGHIAFMNYDPTGSLVNSINYPSVTNYDGTLSSYGESFTYTAESQPASRTDRNGTVTSFSYDANGYPDIITRNANGPPSEQLSLDVDFDQLGRKTRSVDALGHETTYEYDPIGNLRFVRTTVTSQVTGLSEDVVTEYRYDVIGNLTQVIDPEGKGTSLAYNAMDNLSMVTDAKLNTTEYTYDAAYNRTATKDRNGNWTGYAFDKNNNLISLTDPENNTTIYGLDEEGSVVTRTDPLGRMVSWSYDALGRMVSITEPDEGGAQRITAFSYDVMGNFVSETDPAGAVSAYSYDELGRLKQLTDPLGNTVKHRYDGAGNRVRTKDPRGYETNFAYDPNGLLAVVTDAMGGVTSYGYDQNGNLTSQLDAENRVTLYAYDELGRITSEKVDADSGNFLLEKSYTYDRAGNLTKDTTGEGSISYSYDDVYNLTGMTDREGVTYSYSYDPAQNLTSATNAGEANTVSFTYNPRGLMATSADANGGQEAFTYDAAGNLIQRDDTIAGQPFTTTYAHTPRNQLKEVVGLTGTSTATYDPAGRLAAKTAPNGITTAIIHDTAGRITAQIDQKDGNTIQAFTQAFDAAGNLTSFTQAGLGTTTYSYDALNRLTAENIASYGSFYYAYDRVGNRIEHSNPNSYAYYTYNQANQLISKSENEQETTFSYDASGNLTGEQLWGEPLFTYAHNGIDRLKEATSSANGITDSYKYDALGRRISRIQDSSVRNHHQFAASDLDDYVTNESGELFAALTRGTDGLATYTAFTQGGPISGYHLYSPHGDTTAITQADGSVWFDYSYDAFGNALGNEGLAYDYAGKWERERDGLTGMVQMGVRDYDPVSGRFAAVDPLKGPQTDPQQRNRYTYTSNNPLVRYDLGGFYWGESYVNGATDWVEDRASEVQEGWGIAIDDPSKYASGAWEYLFYNDWQLLTSEDSSLSDRLEGGGFLALNFVPGGKLGKAAKLGCVGKGGKLANDLGKAGELAAGIEKNTTRIPSLSGTASFRVPDGLTKTSIVEVKNVSRLSYSSQLRDFAEYAKQTGKNFELYVRPDTQLSGPLQNAINSGVIDLRFLP